MLLVKSCFQNVAKVLFSGLIVLGSFTQATEEEAQVLAIRPLRSLHHSFWNKEKGSGAGEMFPVGPDQKVLDDIVVQKVIAVEPQDLIIRKGRLVWAQLRIEAELLVPVDGETEIFAHFPNERGSSNTAVIENDYFYDRGKRANDSNSLPGESTKPIELHFRRLTTDKNHKPAAPGVQRRIVRVQVQIPMINGYGALAMNGPYKYHLKIAKGPVISLINRLVKGEPPNTWYDKTFTVDQLQATIISDFKVANCIQVIN